MRPTSASKRPLAAKSFGHPLASEIVDREKCVLAVFFGNIKGGAVDILALDRQVLELREYVSADRREFGRVVGAAIENLGFIFLGKCIEAGGEHHYLAGAARRFEQAPRIRIETSWRIGVDVADMLRVVVI